MKVLIVKTSSLGDIIQTFPALDYLKQSLPEAEIHWIVEHPFLELVKAHPLVDKVLTIDSKKWRHAPLSKRSLQQILLSRRALRKNKYDLLFDFQGNVKSALIVASARARRKIGFGWKYVAEWPACLFTHHKVNPPPGRNIREDYLALMQDFFQKPYEPRVFSLKLDPLQQQRLSDLFSQGVHPTLVCPSAAWPNKCLSEEGLIHMLRRIDNGPYWFIWGNLAERQKAIRLAAHFTSSSVMEKMSLPLLQHVMARSRLVITMDSLPLHLCGTTSTPTISFFGPSSSEKYRPLGNHHISIQGKCPYGVRFDKRCPQLRSCATGLCLSGLSSGNMDHIVETEILTRP